MNHNILFGTITALFVFLAAELFAFLAGAYLVPSSLIFYPSFSADEEAELLDEFEYYMAHRDPVLGWPMTAQKQWKRRRDEAGSRYIPGRKNQETMSQGNFCISLYGDSFTWSAEVQAIDAWSTVLSDMLGCPVGNFGVGGYGSDQAYIRYLNNQADSAPIVFLNHLSENILRNSMQFRPLHNGYGIDRNMSGFKPRFIVGNNGKLQMVELPTIDASEYLHLLSHPEKYLPHEYFLPEGDTGYVRFRFPYTWSLARTLGHFHVMAKFLGRPWYMEFYEPNHPSNGLRVTSEILRAFTQSAKERGQVPIVTVIPTGLDLQFYSEKRAWPYQNLIDELVDAGIKPVNFGPGIMRRLDGKDPCSLFDDCSGHFNEEGYRYIGEIAYDELEKRNLLSTVKKEATQSVQNQ